MSVFVHVSSIKTRRSGLTRARYFFHQARRRFLGRRNNLFRSWYNLAMLAAESRQVIRLRSVKLAAGGSKAQREARLMMTEKMAAASRKCGRLIMGASAHSVVKRYRERVKANVRRLSR